MLASFLEPLGYTVQLGVGGVEGRCYTEISMHLFAVGGTSAVLYFLGPQRHCRIFIHHGGRDGEGRKWSNFFLIVFSVYLLKFPYNGFQ